MQEAQGGPPANETKEQATKRRKLAKMNALSLGPVKSLPMTAFMMYMTGNTVDIFPIMVTMMAIQQPITAMGTVTATFAMFEDDEDRDVKSKLFMAKVTFVLCCILALGVGLLKLSWMGLVPTSYADWMDPTPPLVLQTVARGY